MKTYVLTVSRVFPITHKQKGEQTYFPEKILENFDPTIFTPKIHTIRANYELWAKRIKEVQEGKAILSIRYWSGKPYNSKQVEICKLDKDSGIGVQELKFDKGDWSWAWVWDESMIDPVKLFPSYVHLCKNDGLSLEDFKEWFRKYDLSRPMAIIHFTSFRY